MILKLFSTEDAAFQITEISSDLDFISGKITDDQEKSKSLQVKLSDAAPEGKFQGTITLASNIEGQKKIIIPIRGSVIKEN